jgi:DNA-binding MarR family transcriptional regulator
MAYIREFQDAVQSSRLPQAAKALLIHMAVWADYSTGSVGPAYTRSLSGIADATGLNRATVERYLRRLDDAGWITRHRPTLAESRRGVRTWYELTTGKPELGAPGT